ncbi:MAG: dihydroorotate dehydrogenase electron transfer subunit [Ruminiclostridium sp.]|nr:dihydroorotate dehydrogenase electron transfer subunit [Ruminiclostridium sp.]
MNFNTTISKIERLADDIYLLRLQSEEISEQAVPGQFVNIRCSTGLDAYLRRPISICRVDRDHHTFDIVYMNRGRGTNLLCSLCEGDTLDAMGPLGKGFTLPQKGEKIAVVGGGIGIFPLLFLLSESQCAEKTAFLGFRTKEAIVLREEFEKASDKLVIATDDGSDGIDGLITAPFQSWLEEARPDRVYTCGPEPMMNIVGRLCVDKGIFCEVSMEQRMGCGIGACLVCACKVNDADDYQYAHVCKDGPVFPAERVIRW